MQEALGPANIQPTGNKIDQSSDITHGVGVMLQALTPVQSMKSKTMSEIRTNVSNTEYVNVWG